jgi:drug/metabolite transporter (DMT)-like permease
MRLPKNITISFLTSLTFAGAFVAGKYTTLDLLPLTISLLRYIIGFLFMVVLLVHYKASSLKIERKDIFPLVLMGLTGIVGYHFFFFTSLNYTLVANTAIINAFNPAITGILAAVFIKERLTGINYAGSVISITGVLILITKGNLNRLIGMDFNIGDLLMLCAVANWAIYALIAKRIVKKYSGFTATFYSFAFGMTLLVFLAIPEDIGKQLSSVSLRSILSLLFMGIFSSGIGILLYNLSIRLIGPTKTSSLVYSLVPVFVAILAYIFFGEPITPVIVLSMVLIIIGLNMVLRETRFHQPKT